MLAQGARGFMYKSLAPESAMAVLDSGSEDGKMGGVGLQLGVTRAELVKNLFKLSLGAPVMSGAG